MSNEDMASVVALTFFGFMLFLIAVISHPVLTFFIFCLTVIIGGILQTSGRGDGREN